MDFHRVTVVISDKKLAEIAHYIKMEQYTANWLPEHIPAQDLAMTVCQAVRHELDLVVLAHDEVINEILGKVKEKEEK